MIKFRNNIFYIILIIVILLMTYVNIYFYYQKNSSLIFYNELKHKFIDYRGETDEGFLKIFYIYDQFECEQCIVEHLKLLNNLFYNINNLHQIKIFVSCYDKVSSFNFLKYKKIFNLKINYLEFNELIFNFINIELKLPIRYRTLFMD